MPSRPTLLYVFAERMLPHAGPLKRLAGERLVGSGGTGTLVTLARLETWLMAWACWEIADLTLARSPDRLQKGVVRAAPAPATGGPPTGLGGSLHPCVPETGEDVHAVILTWLEGRTPLAMDGVVRHVWDELLAIDGPSTETTRPARHQRWMWNHQLPGVRVEPDQLEGDWERATRAWSALDEDLTEALLHECRVGLRYARGASHADRNSDILDQEL